MNLPPTGDHTPDEFHLPERKLSEVLKRLIRSTIYPIYNTINNERLSRRYATDDFCPDLWLWGQRGNDYERHRKRVAKFMPLKSRDMLVAGCGTARDIESWVRFSPKSVLGVDWFSYARAWNLWQRRYAEVAPEVKVNFAQVDLARMDDYPDAAFDLISSDAVFEHIKNLREVLSEFYRVLKPGGLLYATFGPLWYGYGGDHVSGYDGLLSGYNHLLLNGEEYQLYLKKLGAHSHSEHDGRTWIAHDLFSKLTPRQYLTYLEEAGFKRLFVGAIIDPLAVDCLNNPMFNASGVDRFDILDLLVSGMTIIYER